MTIDEVIEEVLEKEGGYANDPNDAGGETMFGITIGAARKDGYSGAMRDLPRERAKAIYLKTYVLKPGFDKVAARSPRIAAEMVDTGVNMGPAVAAQFLQRALNALNRQGRDYPDIDVDGAIAAASLRALDGFLAKRGKSAGEMILMKAIEALQGERYIRLAEGRPKNEEFLFGWLANRVGLVA